MQRVDVLAWRFWIWEHENSGLAYFVMNNFIFCSNRLLATPTLQTVRSQFLKAGSGENSTAFKGNIDASIGGGGATEATSASFQAEFNGNVEGDIVLKYIYQKNSGGIKNKLTFKGKQGMTGNLSTQDGTHEIIFEKGGLKGNLSILSFDNRSNTAQNKVTFKEENASIVGNISSTLQYLYQSSKVYNNITFEKGGSIKGNINATGPTAGHQGWVNSYRTNTKNTIVFGTKTSTSTASDQTNQKGEITGNIEALLGSNEITFHTKDNKITGNVSGKFGGITLKTTQADLEIVGKLSSTHNTVTNIDIKGDLKINEIDISNNQEVNATIKATGNTTLGSADKIGVIQAGDTSSSQAINTLTFGTQTAVSTAVSSDSTSKTNIYAHLLVANGSSGGASKGKNVLTFYTTTNTITGNISSVDGSNLIKIDAENANTTIKGNLTTTRGKHFIEVSKTGAMTTIDGSVSNYGGTTSIHAKDSTLKFTNETASILVSGGRPAQTVIQAKQLNLNIGSITTQGGSNTNHRNVLIGGAGSEIKLSF